VNSIDVGFISEFVKHIRETSGNPNMFCLGEYWKDSFETNRSVNIRSCPDASINICSSIRRPKCILGEPSLNELKEQLLNFFFGSR
jgi:hypothetical protein